MLYSCYEECPDLLCYYAATIGNSLQTFPGKFIGPFFKGLAFLPTEEGTDKLYQNIGKELPLLAA